MKTLKNCILLIILSIGFTVYGQDNCSYKQMISNIDSISKANEITKGQVKILILKNRFDNLDTRTKSLTGKSDIHFNGAFLVIEDIYFNIDKLLYFSIKPDYIEFLFQGY